MHFSKQYKKIPYDIYITFIIRVQLPQSSKFVDRKFFGKVIGRDKPTLNTLSIFIHGVDSEELYRSFFMHLKCNDYDRDYLPPLRNIREKDLKGFCILKKDDAAFLMGYHWMSGPFKREVFNYEYFY